MLRYVLSEKRAGRRGLVRSEPASPTINARCWPFYNSLYLLAAAMIMTGCGTSSDIGTSPTLSHGLFLGPSAASVLAGRAGLDDASSLSAFILNTDSLSPVILNGRDAIDSFLAKQPDSRSFGSVPDAKTNYVMSTWITGASEHVSFFPDPSASNSYNGHYLLWGGLTDALPDVLSARYRLGADWRCLGCTQPHFATSGELVFDIRTRTGQLNFSSESLALSAEAVMDGNGYFNAPADALSYLELDGNNVNIEGFSLSGGLFGPEAEEAGLLIGIHAGNIYLTGSALGRR